ncbi:MAG: ATP-binding protein [Bacteroidota bacterium]
MSRAKPQLDENGKIQMWVGTSTDIQDQKDFAESLENEVRERTKQLAQNNIELEKMNKELQSFAYISSHDLQEPLRKIQTFASRITEKENDNLSENGKDLFKRMQASAARMQSLIEDLLAYSRTHTLERDFKKVNLSSVIDLVLSDLKEDIQQKNAIIETNKIGEVNIIPFQFQQLFYNLISNSLKFSKPEHLLHIIINSTYNKGSKLDNKKLDNEADYCHISFTDNGIGFEPQYNEKIFELFQRLHGRNEYNGTGIGLAIVKRIVENHNGIITAKSELGKGATFDIYLPLESE